MLRTCPVNNI